eukprot:5200767-Amphidinium_carterae.2
MSNAAKNPKTLRKVLKPLLDLHPGFQNEVWFDVRSGVWDRVVFAEVRRYCVPSTSTLLIAPLGVFSWPCATASVRATIVHSTI